MNQLGPHWTDFHEIRCLNIFLKYIDETQDSLKSGKKKGTLLEDQYAPLIVSPLLLRNGNVSYKICRESQNKHFVFNNFFFSFENRSVYEIMWKTGGIDV